jgi:predicted enzyme related to lactoylglutathione lyase
MEKVLGIGGLFFRAQDPEAYPHGHFACLHDPEGNPIELWEPADEPHS